MLDTREYIVTLKDAADLEDFYQDMENPGGLLYIPNRSVEVSNRRPNSRNTHYFLTDKEANMLRNDPRVLEVELNPRDRGVQPGLTDIQISTAWDKSASDNSNMKNWGLLRCVNGNQIANWGSNGTPSQVASITLTSAGKNVDVVVVDGNGIVWPHPEYTVNSDGTGSSRAIQYNWYQHDPQVKGTPATNYPYTNISDHATHVCGTIAGNTQGWARSANIYNIYYYAGAEGNDNFPYVIDYVREFHRTKPINPVTGRKNPTIVNNSWGMSVFPLEWAYKDITAVTYRGIRYTAGPEVFQGFSGICSATTLISELNVLENSGNSITTGLNSASVVTMVSPAFSDTTNKTVSTQPTWGSNDDGYWQISLPFNISFLGTTYSTVYVGTNMYLTFGSGSTAFSAIDATNPPYPKICLCAKDNSVQRIYYGVEGNSPNRIFTIKVEGTATYLGTLGNPTMVLEYTFFEAVSNNIDLVVGINNSKAIETAFSTEQLIQWGLIEGQRIPQRVAALDADIEDALAEGIIMVGAAGNGKWKHDVPGGVDWNNTFEMAYRYPGQVYYYMRGTSPTANDNKLNGGDFDINNICVGAVGATINESKASFSDCGPGVDLYAPGTYIISALPASASSTPDPRNPSYFIGKSSGTSMASPQVCGVLACALETYPNMNQDQAKEYILHYATSNQMFGGTGGPGDVNDLQGSENLYLFYYKERKDSGNVFPKKDYNIRPESGVVYPRTRIKRSY